MAKRTYVTMSFDIEVNDKTQLRKAAAVRAGAEGMSQEEWSEAREDMCDDLRMLLDPGFIPEAGFSINDSTCEETQL